MKKQFLALFLASAVVMTSSTVSFADFTSIRKGDKGDNVAEIQRVLIEQGYLEGEADGAFGGMTEEAVLKYQSANGLDATGVVGEATYNALMGNNKEEAQESAEVDTAEPVLETEASETETLASEEHAPLLDGIKILEDTNDDLELIDAGYSIDDGYLYYALILRNNSESYGYSMPQVQINARDESGTLLGTEKAYCTSIYPDSDVVTAGMGFSISGQPATVEFEIVPPDDYSRKAVSKDQKVDLTIEGVTKKEEYFTTTYLGEVSNASDKDVDSATVTVVFRNENGSLLSGSSTYVDGLSAGRKAAFELYLFGGESTDNYEIFAEPNDYLW